MKKRFLLVFALLCGLTITGCKETTSKEGVLSAPQQITVQSDGDKSLIIFDEVEGAQYYNIYINDMSVTVKSSGSGTIQFDASKIITLPQKYSIKVKAGSKNHFDSAFTPSYEYNHTGILESPIISVDGTVLNWNKIENAEFYEVVVTTSNPVTETTYISPNNRFVFTNILANKGEYLFKVKAISESGDYSSSIYSNQVRYVKKLDLRTPHNLKVDYDYTTGETLLSFVSSENVDNFTINIDGTNYTFGQNEMQSYLYPHNQELKELYSTEYNLLNVYVIKLTSFATYKGVNVNSSSVVNIKVKANSSNPYLNSSEFSDRVYCQFKSILPTPELKVTSTATTCTLTINRMEPSYLSGFAIYLNEQKYKTVGKDILQIELPISVVGNAGIRVQAISNNNNCQSSNLSNVVYAQTISNSVGQISLNYVNNVVSWTCPKATSYAVEISNAVNRYYVTTSNTSLDLSTICDFGQYNVKVIAMEDGFKQIENDIDVNYSKQLQVPASVQVQTEGDTKYLYFNEVDANGYVLYLNNNMINKLFVSSPINLNEYINEANSYSVKVEAIDVVNSAFVKSGNSAEAIVESVKTLTPPTLTIMNEEDKYYLNIYSNEQELDMISGYEIWINYQSVGTQSKQNTKIDITSYFTNAGQYNFMIKAKAIASPYIKDSNTATFTYNCTKQLDVVTGITVTKLEDESKYILTFNEQTLAAKYLVKIVKADDSEYKEEFELTRGVADISQYVSANGVYRIYVQALALEGGFYTDSANSGNPARLTKGETLSTVENIQINKQSDGSVDLAWDSVENSSGYQVFVYYNNVFGESVLKHSVFVSQATTPKLNIGSGKYKCLNKEGDYTIQIKALGDGKSYETSQTTTYFYDYIMENELDFERNTIFMYGNTYTYKVLTLDDLKNLLWYHYLYNEDVWNDNTLEYNLKVYCDINLDEFVDSEEISETVKTQVKDATSNSAKMDILARYLLNQYVEISSMTLGIEKQNLTQDFCLNEEQDNVYIFRYTDNLDRDKTKTIETTNQVYKDKLDVVDVFDQRSSAYVFAIDRQESIDVTTTEQLFMALQYNKKPNFIGDCAVAKAIYENARFILRQICSDNMTEYQKTLQIYDFLTKRIALNEVNLGAFDDEISLVDSTTTIRGNLKDFYLEGILYNTASEDGLFAELNEFIGQTADSNGIAKVFVALCSIEGIDSIKVNGKKQIMVDNNSTTINYAWNKVYIDIEEDGIDGKKWYAIDIASAINNKIDITKNFATNTYQFGTHQYFLITDDSMNIQSRSFHARLGDATSYVANTAFDYYANQRFTCVYNGNEIVKDANFTASDDQDIGNAIIYAMLKANKTHRIIIDIDAKDYIDGIKMSGDTDILATIKSSVSDIYRNIRTNVVTGYNCSVNVAIVDDLYIVLILESVNYKD